MNQSSIEADRSCTRTLCYVARRFVRRASRAFSPPELSDTAVHETRKDLEKCRTVLRLLRPALGESTFRREDVVLRDAAHTLNAVRDATVLTETLQRLCRRDRALPGHAGMLALQRLLHAGQVREQQRWRARASRRLRTRSALDQLYGRAAHWPVGSHGGAVLGAALRRIYRSGRRRMPTSRPPPTDRRLHEWRKRVKSLRYAIDILAPLRARKRTRLRRRAKQLSDCLGKAHDLAMLARTARVFAKRHRADLRRLFPIIDRRRGRLMREALTRGEQLYRVRPRDWEGQMR